MPIVFQVWQVAPAPSISANSERPGDRAAFLCPACGQDTYRDPDSGHAPERRIIQLALYGYTMTPGPHLGRRTPLEYLELSPSLSSR